MTTDRKETKIALIGAGSLATNLAFNLARRGFNVGQIISKSGDTARILAEQLTDCRFSNQISDLAPDTDLIIIAVNDDAIAGVAAEVAALGLRALSVHTSGSVAMEALSPLGPPLSGGETERNSPPGPPLSGGETFVVSAEGAVVSPPDKGGAGGDQPRIGVFYILQTFSKQKFVDTAHAPIFLEAVQQEDLVLLQNIANKLSDNVQTLDSAARKRLHAGAVFASNFVNYLLHCADRVADNDAQDSPVDYRVYLPLLNEVVEKLNRLAPRDAQTGPARRKDLAVIANHFQLLNEQDPKLASIYQTLSNGIIEWFAE